MRRILPYAAAALVAVVATPIVLAPGGSAPGAPDKTRVTAGKGTGHHVQCKGAERVARGRAAIRSRLEREPVDEVEIGFAIGTIQADDQVEGTSGVHHVCVCFEVLRWLDPATAI